MNAHPDRIGNFNSSTIVALLSNGNRKMTDDELASRPKKGVGSKSTTIEDPSILGESALSYIQECNWERMMGLPIEKETNAKSCAWGSLCERYIQTQPQYLGIEYTQRSDESIVHPEIPWWSGTPDANKTDTVGELKCPWTRKSFCQLVQPIIDGLQGMDAINALRFGYKNKDGIEFPKHKEGETYYTQIVSNAILISKKFNLNIQFGELIIFMPYLTEIGDIKSIAHLSEGKELSKFYSIAMADDEDLPYLIEGGRYKNLNIIRFPIPEADKQLLTERVIEAGKKLVEK